MLQAQHRKNKTGVLLLHVRLPKISGNLLLDHKNFSKFNPDQRLYIVEGAITFLTKLKLWFSLQHRSSLVGLDRCAELGTSIDSSSTKLFLDPKKLIVLGKTLRSAGSSSLDLTRGQTNRQISNKCILSLTANKRNKLTSHIIPSQH
jgi:hypothetical protein